MGLQLFSLPLIKLVCWVEVNTSTSSSGTVHKKGWLGVTHILCWILFLFLLWWCGYFQTVELKSWISTHTAKQNWEKYVYFQTLVLSQKRQIHVWRFIFLFVTHKNCGGTSDTCMLATFLKITEVLLQNLCIVCIRHAIMNTALNHSFSSSLESL